ncbi:MAG TPA: MBL fold metallo-hydrolase [Thermoplasmata archaeon]|nr:MBL fold metallo-hydrolase [Thermoplasmata archaeon]
MGEILPGVHMVEGIDPSPDFSTHVYLVKDRGASWTLIDAGLPGTDAAILRYLGKHQIEPASIRQILITHLHRDHTGGLKRMAEITKAKTFAHWIDAAYIEMKPPYEGKGVPPAEPFSVDERLKDGDRIDAGGGIVTYHTPGHTPGHTSFYLPDRKILFCGDLFFGHGKEAVLTVPDYTHDGPTAQISARRVSGLAVEALLTYHGGPFTSGGRALIERVVQKF